MKSNFPYILLTDDDPEDREMLSKAFLSQNPSADVRGLEDGTALFSYLESCHADNLPVLILLDYKMTVWTAAEILRELSVLHKYAAIPKFVWSTSDRMEYVDQCIRHGASKYFVKPTTVPELDHIITQLSHAFHHQLTQGTA